MKIVILGAGQVGGTLAASLVREDNDITLVDINGGRLRELQHRLDIQTVTGSASHPDVLIRAGCEHADMLIAVTNSDEVNMIGCQVAYSLFRTPTKIARIRSRSYFEYPKLFNPDHAPIDVCISPELLITQQIKRLIEYPGSSQVADFAEGKLQLVTVKTKPEGLMVGKTLKQVYDLLENIELRIAAIFRQDQPIPLSDHTLLNENDEVLFVASPKNTQQILIGLGRYDHPNRRIMIAGGGHIGRRLAEILENDYRVKIIDHKLSHAEFLATTLHKSTVLHGDVADRELLLNENIEFTDVFCAVTNDDEANIMSSLQAKKLGARHALALINRTAYVELIENSGIDHAISPQMATTSSILTKLRRGDIANVHNLRSGNAEAIEIIIHGTEVTSKIIGRRLSDIDLPTGTVILALVRGNKIIMASDDTQFKTEDHVILLVMNKRYIRQLEHLFQVSVDFFS